MLRSVIAVVVGVLVGAIMIFVVEGAGHMIFPPPEGVDMKDPGVLASIMDQIPLGAKIAVLVAWFAGILTGGIVALMIARKWAPVAWVVAATLFGLAVVTMLQIPHPMWMQGGALAAFLLGALGAIKLTGANYQRPVPNPTPGL